MLLELQNVLLGCDANDLSKQLTQEVSSHKH
jgi:hypothetical protein